MSRLVTLVVPLVVPLVRRLAVPAVVGAGLLATTAAVVPAHAGLTIPVSCSMEGEDGLVLGLDDTTYVLDGPCGTVRVTADDAVVTMPTATHLYVTGERNRVTAKSQGLVEVGGADNWLEMTSAESVLVSGPRATVTSPGLVEHLDVTTSAASVLADEVHEAVLRGSDNALSSRRGWRTKVVGDGNAVTHRRLDRLRVRGDHNTVRVERNRPGMRVVGTGNLVRVPHRR